MAVKLLGSDRGFENTTDLVPLSTALTVMFWFRQDIANPSWNDIYVLNGGVVTDEGPYWWIGTNADTLELYLWSDTSETWIDAAVAFTIGQWYHVAIVTDGTTHTCYIDAASIGTPLTFAMSAPKTDVYERLGPPATAAGNFSVAYFRRWTHVLSPTEIAAEMASATAVHTVDLFRDVPLATVSGSDTSGHGHDLTVVGGAGIQIAYGVFDTNWLDLRFDRGAMAVLGALPDYWYWADGYPPALYPEFVTAGNVEVSGNLLQVSDISTEDNESSSEAYFAVGQHPWEPSWGNNVGQPGHGEATWSPNAAHDRLFQEAEITFDQGYFDAIGDWWMAVLAAEGNWFNYGTVYVWLATNTDADGGYAPGYDSFLIETYWQTPTGFGSDYHNAGTFAHADLFDGNPHTLRLEWRGSTITSTVADYTATFPTYYGPRTTLAADGEVFFSVDGITLLEASGLTCQIHMLWAAYNNLPQMEAEFAAIGKYQYINIYPLIGKYGYIKAGAAGVVSAPVISGEWINIADWLDTRIDSAGFPGQVALVLGDLWNGTPGATIQARLWNVTDGVSCGESAILTVTDPTRADFLVTLAAGVREYRLQVTSDTPGTDLFFAGAGIVRTA